jgi:type II secretory pathway component PulF
LNHDEFAFFNQQLAGMLQSGIPLEGALRELTRAMRKGSLRAELEALEADLQTGTPLDVAIQRRKLPATYVAVISAGARTGTLPGVLVLLADYYNRMHAMATRLKGLMTYPAIILAGCFALSLLLAFGYSSLFKAATEELFAFSPRAVNDSSAHLIWVPPVLFFCALMLVLGAFRNGRVRSWFRWHFPGAKEASLAQSASTISLLLSSGTHFDEALGLMQQIEKNTSAAKDIAGWRVGLREGKSRFADVAVVNRAFPPLFIWLVAQGGEDLAQGFARAAEIYNQRASSRTDILLYAALPLAVVVLGLCLLGQMASVVGILVRFVDML